jgi:hypothetical protein
MSDFFTTSVCVSRNYCLKCRTSERYRGAIVSSFNNPSDVNFECPFGIVSQDVVLEHRNALRLESSRRMAKFQSMQVSDDSAESEVKLEICKACEFYSNEKCSKCNCNAKLKIRLKDGSCPIAKW